MLLLCKLAVVERGGINPSIRAQGGVVISISTDGLDGHDRQAFWTDVVCAHLVQADCECLLGPQVFEGRVDLHRLASGGASVSRIRSQAQRVRRGRAHIAQASDEHVLVNIQRHGVGRVSQDGREAVLHPGDLAVYTSDRPYELAFDAGFEQTVLILPAAVVRAQIPSLSRLTAQRIEASSPAGGLLRQAAQAVMSGVSVDAGPHWEQALVSLLGAAMHEDQGEVGAPSWGAAMGDDRRRGESLSSREAEVLQLVARGLTYEDIARHLALSITTVRSHVRSLYGKLGAHNKTEAVFEARLAGWLR